MNRKLTATTLLAILFLVSASMVLSASAQATQTATVIIESSVGGTVDPVPGTYTVNQGQNMNFTATANAGFKFSYWVVAGNYTLGHNVPASYLPTDTTLTPEYVPVYPDPSTSASDSLIITQNPLIVYHGFGYTYEYQAIFTPINSATPTPSPPPTTASPTAAPVGGGLSTDSLYAIIAILVVIVVIVLVVAAVFARRARK